MNIVLKYIILFFTKYSYQSIIAFFYIYTKREFIDGKPPSQLPNNSRLQLFTPTDCSKNLVTLANNQLYLCENEIQAVFFIFISSTDQHTYAQTHKQYQNTTRLVLIFFMFFQFHLNFH